MALLKLVKTYGFGMAWLAGSAGSVFISMYPHTLGLEQFKKAIDVDDNYSDADDEVLLLAEEMKLKMKWQDTMINTKHLLTFMQTPSLNVFHLGSVNLVKGGIIGVPAIFTTASIKQAEKNPENLASYNIYTKTEEGKKLFDTFKLSESAKKFVIARELYRVRSFQVFVDSFSLGFAVIACYVIPMMFHEVFRVRGLKTLSFLVTIPMMASGYTAAIDRYHCGLEKRADKAVGKLCLEMAHGGIEYYTTLSKRNEIVSKNPSKFSALVQQNETVVRSSTLLKYLQTREFLFSEWRKPTCGVEERRNALIEVSKLFCPPET